MPKAEAARQALAAQMGADGQTLLDAIAAASDYGWLANLPAVQTLRRVWEQQYRTVEGVLGWRAVADMPAPAETIDSPYDTEARYSVKRDTTWVGYKVHQTEACDADAPRSIVNVETAVASVPDDTMLATVHAALARRDLLPAEHLVDKGYSSAQVLLDSERNDGVRIIGPVADDPSWQAQAGAGFDKAHFRIDWDACVVTCPAGRHSRSWLPKTSIRRPRSPESSRRPVSRRTIARHVPTAPTAPDQKSSLVSSVYNPATNTSGYRRPARFKPPRRSAASMPPAPGSRAPTRKPSAAAVCASAGISDWPRPACSM